MTTTASPTGLKGSGWVSFFDNSLRIELDERGMVDVKVWRDKRDFNTMDCGHEHARCGRDQLGRLPAGGLAALPEETIHDVRARGLREAQERSRQRRAPQHPDGAEAAGAGGSVSAGDPRHGLHSVLRDRPREGSGRALLQGLRVDRAVGQVLGRDPRGRQEPAAVLRRAGRPAKPRSGASRPPRRPAARPSIWRIPPTT